MTNSEKKYHRSELAKQQLMTAVMLFLNYIDNMFGINVQKHMSPSCPKTCDLNLHECAINSITIAISDYVTLYGQNDDFVIAYLTWSWNRADGNKIFEAYNNMPNKLKKTETIPNKEKLGKAKNKVVTQPKKTTVLTYKRFQLAANQLETAIYLFLTKIDKLSAITLAGAADVIFCELVNREGKKNFTDLLFEKASGQYKHREKLGREVNDILYINFLKHFDKNDAEHIELDVEECAVGTILKALVNYNMLDGKNEQLVVAFRHWVKNNLDPEKYNLVDPE